MNQHEVGEFAGCQGTLFVFLKLGIGTARGVGPQRLFDRDLLRRYPAAGVSMPSKVRRITAPLTPWMRVNGSRP